MPSYGYKLFEFNVFEGDRRKNIDFADAQGQSYASRAKAMLLAAQQRTFAGPVLVEPSTPSAAVDHTGRQLLSVRNLRAASHTIFGEVSAAKVGQIEDALGVPGISSDVDLRKHGPRRSWNRFAILTPAGGDSSGLVVVEAIGRSCPNAPLQYALTQMSIAAAKAAGPAPDGSVPDHFRARLRPLADPDHLEKVLAASNQAEIRLTKRGTGIGRGRESKEIEVFAAAVGGSKLSAVGDVLKAWRQAKKSNDQVSAAQGAKALAEIVGGESLSDLDFDEGTLTIDDQGHLKMITPALTEEIFLYPIASRLSDKDWFHHVAAQAQASVQGQSVNVVWPAWATLHVV